MKNAGIALAFVLAILAVVYVGVELLNLDFFFGGVLPYIAIAVFIVRALFTEFINGPVTGSIQNSNHCRPAEILGFH